MGKTVLAISNAPDSSWLRALGDALGALGALQVTSDQQVWTLLSTQDYDLMLLDAAGIDEGLVDLIVHLRQECRHAPIVVVTTSPTWERSRLAFRAGANDYVRKSLDKNTILASLQEFLQLD